MEQINYYKKLAMKFHPDNNKGSSTSCTAILKVINKLHKENKQAELKNLYYRLHTGFKR